MRCSIGPFSLPRQYAPATFISLKWPSRDVDGTCGPRHRSTNSGVLRYTLIVSPPADLAGVERVVGAAAVTRSMISRLYGWSANSASASSAGTSVRTNGWSALMISRIRASIAARSSSLNVRPPGSSKS